MLPDPAPEELSEAMARQARSLRRSAEDLARTALKPFATTDLCCIDPYHGAAAGVARSGHLFWRLLDSLPGLQTQRALPGKSYPLTLGRVRAALWLANARDLPRTRAKLPWLARTAEAQLAYWYYELDHLPEEEARAAAPLAEIWTASQFGAEAIRRSCATPAFVIPPPILLDADEDKRPEYEVSKDDPARPANRYLLQFDAYSSVERKNPWCAVEAFEKAFHHRPEKTLTLRVSRAEGLTEELRQRLQGCHSGQVTVRFETFATTAESHNFLRQHDVYLSPHRSEGLGLNVAEAILFGLQVVATGYGGSTDFCDPQGVDLIDHDLVTGDDPQGLYTGSFQWAAPRVDHLCALLKKTADRLPPEIVHRRHLARQAVHQHFATARIRALVEERLSHLLGRATS